MVCEDGSGHVKLPAQPTVQILVVPELLVVSSSIVWLSFLSPIGSKSIEG